MRASETGRPSTAEQASGADGSGASRSGVRHPAARPYWTCWTDRSTRPPLSTEAALAAAGTARAESARSAAEARSRRATLPGSTPPGPSPVSALEEELRFLVVDEEPDFFGEDVVLFQARVVVDDVESDLSGPTHPLPITPQRRQLEVAAPLLPRAQHRALASDV